MSTKPANPSPGWAEGPGENVNAPPSGLKQTGFLQHTARRADFINSNLRGLWRWAQYLYDGVIKNVRYMFADARIVVVSCGPDIGGYQINALTVPGHLWTASGRRMGITNSTGSSGGCEARRPVELLLYIPAEAATPRFRAVGLAASWSAGSGNASLVFKSRPFGSDTETVILTSTPATPTEDQSGSPIAMDLQANVYWMEFATGSLADTATSERVCDALLQIEQLEL